MAGLSYPLTAHLGARKGVGHKRQQATVLRGHDSLLLRIFDDVRRANFRFVRIVPHIAKSTPLTQEVPALIQFDLNLCEPLTVGF